MGLRGIAVDVVYYPANFGNIKLLLLYVRWDVYPPYGRLYKT